MWCAKCQALVGHASDDGPSQCPRCGAEVVDAPSDNDATGKARELLERWATDDPLKVTSGILAAARTSWLKHRRPGLALGHKYHKPLDEHGRPQPDQRGCLDDRQYLQRPGITRSD